MSLIRDLTEDYIAGSDRSIQEQIVAQRGRPLMRGTVKVHIVDDLDVAIVNISGAAVGVLSIDYSEPCLIYTPLPK